MFHYWLLDNYVFMSIRQNIATHQMNHHITHQSSDTAWLESDKEINHIGPIDHINPQSYLNI